MLKYSEIITKLPTRSTIKDMVSLAGLLTVSVVMIAGGFLYVRMSKAGSDLLKRLLSTGM